MANYTNSSLVSHTRLSPNHSGKRTHAIDTITPHCVVGQCSVETIGNIFAPSTRQASSNYGVGSDGRVGMYVEEKNRSWCTSSNANDQRAVTIEVASDTKHPYTINDKAKSGLINLMVDICKRNGKNKCVWIADKTKMLAYAPKSNEMRITVHRWFANKSCPGDDMYGDMPEIISKVNTVLSGGTVITTPVVTPSGEDPAYAPKEVIWKYLSSKGLNDFAVAGIMGNLYAESGLQPNNLQNSYEKKLGHTDESYTKAVDNGTYTKFATDGAGYGIAQWTYSTRKKGLLDLAKKKKSSISDINVQLEYLWNELQTMPKVMNVLKVATSVQQASDIFLTEFEKPASADKYKKTRAQYGQEYYDKYHGKGVPNASKLPYKVRITADDLNIRSVPSTSKGNSTVVGSIKDHGIYTIVEESIGVGATMWGKLKSGAGWISLDYTKKV
ncbi:MAG: phage tail tip lysozyme [Lachnospiraceae bacterium]|nr:phage tail tip lysozyme [Lachnospiraceae bacterium]